MDKLLACLIFAFYLSSEAAAKSGSEILLNQKSESGCADGTYTVPKGKFNEAQRNWIRSILTYLEPNMRSTQDEVTFQRPSGKPFLRVQGDELKLVVASLEFEKWASPTLKDHLKVLLLKRNEILAQPAKSPADQLMKMTPAEAEFQKRVAKIYDFLEREVGLSAKFTDGGPGCMH